MQSNINQNGINREDYERDLKQRQSEHLKNVQGFNQSNWRPCMHDACTQCLGTGVRADGSACIHGISCPCPKCSASFCVQM